MSRPAHVPPLHQAASSLESFLGDPRDPALPFSHAAAVALDEQAAYPHAEVALLREWGLQEWFVPAELGGKAVNVEDGGNLIRLVARRDVTAATAMSINAIAYTAIWAGGSDEQKAQFADRVLCGSRLAWALSERSHGSDLLANETTATKVDDGWVLSGEKWLIGNATLSDVALVVARTGASGPGAHSLFAVDKRRCRADQLRDLPNEPPVGLRGFDLSGLAFLDCRVPDDALIGGVGHGLEIVLKASQMARTNLNFLALGALDTGLRLTLDFARERRIFDTTVWEIPYSRSQLVESFGDLLVADALTTGAVRALQLAPEQASSWSSIAKYLVPTIVDEAMTRCAVVLGARHYLRSGPWAIFQKMARDLIVADFADGNTVVNLKTVVAQLAGGLTGLAGASDEQRRGAAERVATIFGLGQDLPGYRPESQQLFTRRPDDCLLALPDTVVALRARGGEWVRVAEAGDVVLDRIDVLRRQVEALRRDHGSGYSQAPATFAAAKSYCHLFAAAAYLHLQRYAAAELDPRLADPRLALVALDRVAHRGSAGPAVDPDDLEAAALALEGLHEDGLLLAHRTVTLPLREEWAA